MVLLAYKIKYHDWQYWKSMENCRCLKYTVGKTEVGDFVDLI